MFLAGISAYFCVFQSMCLADDSCWLQGLEKYLMTKLFSRAFAPLPEEIEHDQKLTEKIGMLQQFIRPEHLDIPANFRNESSWLVLCTTSRTGYS